MNICSKQVALLALLVIWMPASLQDGLLWERHRTSLQCRTGASCLATCCCCCVCRFHIFTMLSHPPASFSFACQECCAAQLQCAVSVQHNKSLIAKGSPEQWSRLFEPKHRPEKTVEPSGDQAEHSTGWSWLIAALGTEEPLLWISQHLQAGHAAASAWGMPGTLQLLAETRTAPGRPRKAGR